MHQGFDVEDDLVLVEHWTIGFGKCVSRRLVPLGVARLLRCVLRDAENTRDPKKPTRTLRPRGVFELPHIRYPEPSDVARVDVEPR